MSTVMTPAFLKAFKWLMGSEGGYSNDPRDPGGETMWGVTLRVARRYGYTGKMRELPLATAQEIAKKVYWDTNQCDSFPLPIAFQIFDTAYNGGHPIAWLQDAVDVSVTGRITQELIEKVNQADIWKLVALFNAKRLRYLASLKQPAFANGRMNRIADNLERGGV